MLPDETEDEILFFGGKDYVALFCELTKDVKSRRTAFYSSAEPPEARGGMLAKFDITTRTNWHYEGRSFEAGNPMWDRELE
jgi:hypothetical protein